MYKPLALSGKICSTGEKQTTNFGNDVFTTNGKIQSNCPEKEWRHFRRNKDKFLGTETLYLQK